MHVHTLLTRKKCTRQVHMWTEYRKEYNKSCTFFQTVSEFYFRVLLQSSTSEFCLSNSYLLVLNMDTQSTSRRALKWPQEQEDRRCSRNKWERARRAAETAQQKSERLRKQRERDRARCAAQTASESPATLQKKSTCEHERMASETQEGKKVRLQWIRDTLAAEAPEETEGRLQQMRDRLAAPEETEARLQQMRNRLAAETPEEMETRLQDRLAVETPEETETKLQYLPTQKVGSWNPWGERSKITADEQLSAQKISSVKLLRRNKITMLSYKEQSVQPQLPLFQQCSVKAKLRKFHANMATLDTPVYALLAQWNSLASSFTQTQLSVCIVAMTSIFRKCITLPTTWTQAPYHHNCRLAAQT